MSNFITNSPQRSLRKRLHELVLNSEELKFLIGFFYFSGLKELYEGLKENPQVLVKVLVGLNVDKTSYGLVEYGDNNKRLSDSERLERFFSSIKKAINSDEFDNKEFYEQAKFFLNLIRENRLIIRKTFEPNHAKLYFFKLQKNQIARSSLFITGSSNLTFSGLNAQHEFNVEISDYGTEEAEAYFDNFWQKAIFVTENDLIKKRLLETLEKETLIKEITPFEAYALVLKSYLDTFRGREVSEGLKEILKENGFKEYQYQLDAVRQALSIIEQNNGVVIADVVGLGKTVIASLVAYELKKRGIVIAPPGLIGDELGSEGWKKYLEDFKLSNLGWKAFSRGILEEVAQFVSKTKDIEVVIVDEAHRFRNQDSKSYELLKNICRGKIVILLTATPFNNRPSDIFSLLKLFITPKKSSITLSENVELKFMEYQSIFQKLSYITRYAKSKDPNKRERTNFLYELLFHEKEVNLQKVKKHAQKIAKEIKNVIEPITIRRNRLDLQQNPLYKNEIKELSKVEDPQEWFFELTKKQSEFYDRVIKKYFALPEEKGDFKGAIYRPYIYKVGVASSSEFEREENFQYLQQFNLYDLMRRLLVKRFESSFGAFKQSLENFKQITEVVLGFIKKTGKYILDRQLLDKIYERPLEEIEEELMLYSERVKKGEYPKHHEVYEIEKFKDKDLFLKDIESDRNLFQKILKELEELNLVSHDPKAKTLVENITLSLKKEPERKIVVFSEYRDTVKYLAGILKENFKDRVLVISDKLTKAKTEEISQNFDAAYPKEKQANNYDILLATDMISEGFNLNRAGMVINYDIPWNPVIVIQRVGRINRISKKVFDSLYIVNFFPTEKGADFIKNKEIAREKMFLIHHALGEDAKIFDVDEEPSASKLYERIQKNPDLLESESFYTKVLREFEQIKKENPGLIERLKNFPPRIKVAKNAQKDELFVVIKKGRLFINYKDYNKDEVEQKNLEDVLESLKPSSPEERSLPLSERFWDEYEKTKKFREVTTTLLLEQSIEQKALNNLKSALKIQDDVELIALKDFIRMLIEDILDYGTLADYTLRRLANLDFGKIKQAKEEIEKIKEELGENYLEKEKERLKHLFLEIIIAVENRK